MEDSLTENNQSLQKKLELQTRNFELNLSRVMEMYLQIKAFRHFRQKFIMTQQLKEITSYKKKIKNMQANLQQLFQDSLSSIKDLTIRDLIDCFKFVEELLTKKNFAIKQKTEEQNNIFQKIKNMKDTNIIELDSEQKKTHFVYKFWDMYLGQKENDFLLHIFAKYHNQNLSQQNQIQENQIIQDLLKLSLKVYMEYYMQLLENELQKIDVLVQYVYHYRKKTTVFQILFKFLFKIDTGIKLYKQPYQNVLILLFLVIVNIVQITPYYNFSTNWESFIDFLKYDEYSFFSNLYLNVLFFYITLCYVMFMKYLGEMSRIFSYQKFFISCFIYYGMDVKRHSIIANWNNKSNILDLNIELIILYIYLAIYLMFQKTQNFLKRFHNIKNRNKILRYHNNVMRQLKNKFIPVLINNLLNIALLIFFHNLCKNFQVNISEIFMPFIILQFQNIGILLYFIMVQVVKKKQGLSQVKIFEISYLILKAYCFFVYIGIFLYKINLIVVQHKGHFIFEEILFVLVVVGMAVLNFNEFWIKYFVFKKNLKFNEKEFEEEQTCPICWEKTNSGIHTDCNHYFHQECLFSWFENNAWNSINCPICRQEF